MLAALVVETSTADKGDAQRLARLLVEHRLAACAQVSGPLESTYRWQGKIETATEWLCTAKTLADRYERVEALIREHHPYDEPEILAVRVHAGSAGYLHWLAEQLG